MIRDPESILGSEDGAAYRRFLDWSPGAGFDLAIVKVTLPAKRDALIAWTKEQIPKAIEIDLRQVSPERSRLWDLLNTAVQEQGATMLIAYGLEQALDPARILAQLNVERDELVKAFALPWILFVHPAVYADVVHKAPDFVDFAGLWLEEAHSDVVAESLVVMPEVRAEAFGHVADETSGKRDLLTEAAQAIATWRMDEARDLLAQYGLTHPEPPRDNADGALARCLRAFVDNRQEEALRLLREEWSPVVERLGNARERALTLGQVADILFARGELDEALRIRQQEELPVYMRLGDDHSYAVTLGQVADILFLRGNLDEALRIRQEAVLPIYKRLGDVRNCAVTRGKVADILQLRGELDEALRIRREEELPVYDNLGDLREWAVASEKMADILYLRGDSDEALRILHNEVLPAFKRLGSERAVATALGHAADILQSRGQWDEVLRIRREQELPVYDRLGDMRALLVGRANVAVALIERGRSEDAPEITRLLALALTDARRLRLPEAQQIETIIRHIGLDPNAPPFV